jgi:predicted DNA-binding transcriptional regulator AlpA
MRTAQTTAVATVPRRIHVSDDDSFWLIGDLLEHFRCSRMWIERKLKDETLPFPKAVKLGGPTSARRWRRSDVFAWERERANLSARLS